MTNLIVEHRELLEEFFLEALPNPDRVGCPDEDAMQACRERTGCKRSCASPCGFLFGVLSRVPALPS